MREPRQHRVTLATGTSSARLDSLFQRERVTCTGLVSSSCKSYCAFPALEAQRCSYRILAVPLILSRPNSRIKCRMSSRSFHFMWNYTIRCFCSLFWFYQEFSRWTSHFTASAELSCGNLWLTATPVALQSATVFGRSHNRDNTLFHSHLNFNQGRKSMGVWEVGGGICWTRTRRTAAAGAKVVGAGVRANALQCRGALAMLTFQSLLLLRLTVKPLRQLTKLIAAKKKSPLTPSQNRAAVGPTASVMVKSTEPLINGCTQATK